MFHRDTASKTRIGLKAILAAGVTAAALAALASPASAATAIYLDKAEMFKPVTVSFQNTNGTHYPAYSGVYDGPVLFTANYGTSASSNTFNFLGFCVDIFDEIQVGINQPANVNLAYQTSTLTNNGGSASNGTLHTIDATSLLNINKLLVFGNSLWAQASVTDPTHANVSSTLANQLAAVQGAIWEIENPGLNVVAPSAVENLMSTYEGSTFLDNRGAGNMTVIVDTHQPLHQAFAFTTSVPEPSTWAMMILGLGGVGAAMRRQRAQARMAVA